MPVVRGGFFMNKNVREQNIKACLEFCLSMSDDKEFKKRISRATHEERVVFLLDNGFEFDGTEDENAELEKLYREKVKTSKQDND